MAASRDRQIWIGGTQRWCQHAPESIYNQSDKLIAELCRLCGVRLAEIGQCDGAGKGDWCRKTGDVRLTAFLATGKRARRFCSDACRQATILAEKLARDEASEKARVVHAAKGARR